MRKDEKGSPVSYADKFRKSETDSTTGEASEREIFFLKQYTVFNVEQIDGLPTHFYVVAAPQISQMAKREQAEAFFAALGADIRHGGNRAFYAVDADFVQMPPQAA